MKLVPLGETDAGACVDGVCEVPRADYSGSVMSATVAPNDAINSEPDTKTE